MNPRRCGYTFSPDETSYCVFEEGHAGACGLITGRTRPSVRNTDSSSDTQEGPNDEVERLAKIAAASWGYEWDVPADHYCDDICDYLCDDEADFKPTKDDFRKAVRAVLGGLASPRQATAKAGA